MFLSCYFCKKNRIILNKSEEKLTNILTHEAQEILKKVVALPNDYIMLGVISDGDLSASA